MEKKIIITVKYHFFPTKLANIRSLVKNSEDMEYPFYLSLFTARRDVKSLNHFRKQYGGDLSSIQLSNSCQSSLKIEAIQRCLSKTSIFTHPTSELIFPHIDFKVVFPMSHFTCALPLLYKRKPYSLIPNITMIHRTIT